MAEPIPAPSLRRLPHYLRLLRQWEAEGRDTVSCTHLAEALGQDPTQVRKDLALCGVAGRPKIGYQLVELAEGIERFLGWDNATEAFLVGAGHLGSALLGYQGFARLGLSVVAAFDADPAKVGTQIHERPVFAMAKLPDLARRMHVRMGILAVPAEAAAEAGKAMAAAGLTAVWNFTPARLDLPGLIVEDVDLAQSLAVLSHRLAAAGRRPRPAPR